MKRGEEAYQKNAEGVEMREVRIRVRIKEGVGVWTESKLGRWWCHSPRKEVSKHWPMGEGRL